MMTQQNPVERTPALENCKVPTTGELPLHGFRQHHQIPAQPSRKLLLANLAFSRKGLDLGRSFASYLTPAQFFPKKLEPPSLYPPAPGCGL